MRVTRKHELGQAEALRRLKKTVKWLTETDWPGVKIKEPGVTWKGGECTFSFKAKKALFSARITGDASVTDDTVSIECRIPDWVLIFVPESTIRSTIVKHIGEILRD